MTFMNEFASTWFLTIFLHFMDPLEHNKNIESFIPFTHIIQFVCVFKYLFTIHTGVV